MYNCVLDYYMTRYFQNQTAQKHGEIDEKKCSKVLAFWKLSKFEASSVLFLKNISVQPYLSQCTMLETNKHILV